MLFLFHSQILGISSHILESLHFARRPADLQMGNSFRRTQSKMHIIGTCRLKTPAADDLIPEGRVGVQNSHYTPNRAARGLLISNQTDRYPVVFFR